MISTYEKCLITFKKWFHITSISEIFVVAEFCHESIIKNLTTCSECDLKLNNWKFKRDSIKIHVRQSSNCLFVQRLNKKETSTNISIIVVKNSTSTKLVSINYSAFSPQIFYLIIVDLYRKQKILLIKTEENVKTFKIPYEKRLISYKNWFHDKFSTIDTIAIEFWHKSDTTNIIICFECDAI